MLFVDRTSHLPQTQNTHIQSKPTQWDLTGKDIGPENVHMFRAQKSNF